MKTKFYLIILLFLGFLGLGQIVTTQQQQIELSAEMHERLVTIHPFIDGNGRTSRLLMNLILLQNGFPIAILKGDTESRLKYYGALETAQTENSKQPFIDFITENVSETMERL
ncbi:Fic family protein [Chryseobacterium sp. SC28]|uniref:Fic family protein n=1 Tax=Chryseobacterium sp. SC28 TaxID=2268028 RepID=UPI000F651A16|nr:Fic family protein [Chryseobacterium sp. SC28]RRQ47154.1 hypothetical protein DTW91_00240 [Chryseobacterium sp. SC28]